MKSLLSKIKYYLKKIISFYLIDSNTTYYKQEKFLNLIWKTTRYRLASLNLPITQNEKQLLSFKNKHSGKRVFIIGNGPSLNSLDLSFLKNELTFGVNGIYLNYEKMKFMPTYYVVEDVFVAEDRADEINSLKNTIKFYGNYLDYCIKKGENVIWTNTIVNYNDYKDFPHFSTNASRSLWVGGTVSYLNLQLAYYMGFKEVYLIGFDHNYTIPTSALIEGCDIKSTEDDTNHFNPNYFGKGYRWHDPEVLRMEKALYKAKLYFEKDNRRIYNATKGGKLEVFDRIDYNSLF
jgi:hypothetical protein